MPASQLGDELTDTAGQTLAVTPARGEVKFGIGRLCVHCSSCRMGDGGIGRGPESKFRIQNLRKERKPFFTFQWFVRWLDVVKGGIGRLYSWLSHSAFGEERFGGRTVGKKFIKAACLVNKN